MVMNKKLLALVVLATLSDQAVVIGIEKKEDKWHEKGGLTSLYNNLVPFSSVPQQLHNSYSTVTRQSHDSCTTVTRQSHDRPNIKKLIVYVKSSNFLLLQL